MKYFITPYVIAKETEMVIDTLAPKLFARLHVLVYPVAEIVGLEVSVEARTHNENLFGMRFLVRYEELAMNLDEFSKRIIHPRVYGLMRAAECDHGRS